MASVIIKSGACGFTTEVNASSEDSQNVTLTIKSECATVKRLSELLGSVDAYQELVAGYEGAVHTAAKNAGKGCCTGCVAPAGILKVVQVAAGLALPADASIIFDK